MLNNVIFTKNKKNSIFFFKLKSSKISPADRAHHHIAMRYQYYCLLKASLTVRCLRKLCKMSTNFNDSEYFSLMELTISLLQL